MKMKPWMKDYFNFSRKDRTAILVLVTLIFLTLLLPHFFSNAIHTTPEKADTAWMALVRALVIKQDSEHLVHSPWKKPESRPSFYQYPDSGSRWKHRDFPARGERSYQPRRYGIYSPSPIDINTADTTAFIALPGIGSRLAERIVRFREKLGGFYSINQVGEVYGLPDSVFQKLRPLLLMASFTVKRININTATLDELKVHPYIRYAIANSIVQYRNQHGDFLKTEDLKKIVLITDDTYNKFLPYLTTGE